MKIRVTGIEQAIEQIRGYQRSLSEKQRVFLSELAKIGIDVATARFQEAQYDGDNDVLVYGVPEWVGENRLFIRASGHSVLFVEFGTGVHYSEQHPKAAELGFVRGGYGQGKGRQDSWAYYGVPGTNGKIVRESSRGSVIVTQGNPPARAMYDAAKEMRNRILEIARGVFK